MGKNFSSHFTFSINFAVAFMSIHYQIGITAVLLTTGIIILGVLYRYYIRNVWKTKVYIPSIILHNLENSVAIGDILFHIELSAKQNIVLEIANTNFDSLKIILNEDRESGAYGVPFNTRELPNGDYFYRLKNKTHQIAKKFTVKNN